MSARMDRLRERLGELEAAAFLVTGLVNVRYLTGFESSNAALVIDPERTWLLTDGRYAEAARAVPGVEPIQAERDLAHDLRGRLSTLAAGPVAFEADHVTYATYSTIAEGGATLVPTRKVVEGIRAVKDPDELDAVRRAAAILNDTLERFAGEPVTGRTEAEVAWWLERTMREAGAEALSFEPIVASGPNSALPHHHPGGRVIQAGEIVLVDAGCRVDGYCSDCTRTFATGALPPALERAYAVCLEAELASLEGVRAGAVCSEVDAIQRSRLEEHGYTVLHSLGHAVGLEIHEEPRLTDTSTDALVAGNVVTVEPGVYLAGLGGVRIEDLVIVGEDGPEVLTPVTKELVRVS